MAINPNTDFTTGQVLTASQSNRFPRGVVAYGEAIANVVVNAVEVITVTSSSFTAVANRYYKITYYEPAMNPPGGAGGYIFARIRLTNLAGAQIQQMQLQESGATNVASFGVCEVITTFTAGSKVVVGTCQAGAAGGAVYRGATQKAFIVVEDIGPA